MFFNFSYMRRWLLFIVFVLLPLFNRAQSHRLLFKTSYGTFKVMLYDFTPQHQKLILEAVGEKVYHQALFNRIIAGFVVQGGEHDDDIAKREHQLSETERKRLPAEFDARAYHKKGAIGAGRDDNPSKASFLNQIYFVIGKPVTIEELNKYEIEKGISYSQEQRHTYLSEGGLPRLDGDYTVFGEVYEGFEVLLHISNLKTNAKDAPLTPVVFDIEEIP